MPNHHNKLPSYSSYLMKFHFARNWASGAATPIVLCSQSDFPVWTAETLQHWAPRQDHRRIYRWVRKRGLGDGFEGVWNFEEFWNLQGVCDLHKISSFQKYWSLRRYFCFQGFINSDCLLSFLVIYLAGCNMIFLFFGFFLHFAYRGNLFHSILSLLSFIKLLTGLRIFFK